MAERWLPVVGYEEQYQVSDAGRIRRIGHGRGSVDGRLLTLGRHAQGYRTAILWKDNVGSMNLVHRLVLAAFEGACPDGHEVNHKNGVKTDNCLGNLEYMTREQNIAHAMAYGLMRLIGEDNPMAILTTRQVEEIRATYEPGTVGYKRLGNRYGVSWETIRNIIKRRSWDAV